MVLCHAHAMADDSFDEEYEAANYNLAQVAELEAAARLQSLQYQQPVPVQQPQQVPQQFYQQVQQVQQPQATYQQQQQQQQSYPVQYGYTHKQVNNSSDPMQIDNLVSSANTGFPPSNSRKLKRSCEFECESAVDASGSKRVKQIAF